MVPKADSDTEIASLVSGESDFIFPQAYAGIADALKDPNIKTTPGYGTNYEGLYFQQGVDCTPDQSRSCAFKDADFRHAFAKSIDRNTPKLAATRPNAQQVWSSLQALFAIGPKTWLVIDPTDVALAPIRGSGLNVTSALILRAHTRVIVGEKPVMTAKPLPPLRSATSTDDAIRIPFDVEIPYSEVSRLLTSQFGKRTYKIEGGTLAVDTIEISAGTNGKMNVAAAIDYRGGHLKKYHGVVYLDGIAKFDPASSRVVIEDLEYSIDPKRHGITRALDRIAHEAVRARLRDSAKWPVTDDVASLKNEIERGVTRQLAPGVNLRGHVDSIEPVSATPTSTGLVIRVTAVGRAEVELTALSEGRTPSSARPRASAASPR